HGAAAVVVPRGVLQSPEPCELQQPGEQRQRAGGSGPHHRHGDGGAHHSIRAPTGLLIPSLCGHRQHVTATSRGAKTDAATTSSAPPVTYTTTASEIARLIVSSNAARCRRSRPGLSGYGSQKSGVRSQNGAG